MSRFLTAFFVGVAVLLLSGCGAEPTEPQPATAAPVAEPGKQPRVERGERRPPPPPRRT